MLQQINSKNDAQTSKLVEKGLWDIACNGTTSPVRQYVGIIANARKHQQDFAKTTNAKLNEDTKQWACTITQKIKKTKQGAHFGISPWCAFYGFGLEKAVTEIIDFFTGGRRTLIVERFLTDFPGVNLSTEAPKITTTHPKTNSIFAFLTEGENGIQCINPQKDGFSEIARKTRKKYNTILKTLREINGNPKNTPLPPDDISLIINRKIAQCSGLTLGQWLTAYGFHPETALKDLQSQGQSTTKDRFNKDFPGILDGLFSKLSDEQTPPSPSEDARDFAIKIESVIKKEVETLKANKDISLSFGGKTGMFLEEELIVKTLRAAASQLSIVFMSELELELKRVQAEKSYTTETRICRQSRITFTSGGARNIELVLAGSATSDDIDFASNLTGKKLKISTLD